MIRKSMEPFIQFIVYIFADIIFGVSCDNIYSELLKKESMRIHIHSPSRNKDARALRSSLDEKLKLEE